MVTVREVKTKREQKEFLEFPLRLYKDSPYYSPALYIDEKKIFRSDYVYYDTCIAVYYNAYLDGRIAGRISGILQRSSNEKWGQKRVRFTRFDCIDNLDVARALFDAVENFAREQGMTEVVGPLGFSDLEREGLLIDGFDRDSTFEEQYNAPYYQKLIEALGYVKEVDWVESMVYAPEQGSADLKRVAEYVMKRYKLHRGESKSTRDFLNRYADGFFELLDVGYDKIYGTVPFTDGMRKMLIDNFKLVINRKYVSAILDENDRVICFGLGFPSLTKALRKSGGRLTPATLVRVVHTLRSPEVLEMGLIAVDPSYINRSVPALICAELADMLAQSGIDHAETNLNLEDNYAIRNLWKRFRSVEHKRRRSYVKKLM